MTAIWTTAPFTWQDGERKIRYGRGALATAGELLGEGYLLLTTERARASAPDVVAAAGSVVELGDGYVEELAADVLSGLSSPPDLVVALGGGRIVDTAKAVAAASGARAAAIPTTLSAAEMTKIHRRASGAPEGTGTVRPAVVLNDPALSASQPAEALAASAANSLAHAVESAVTRSASPLPRAASLETLRLTADAYAREGDPDDEARDQLALAAVLSGYTIDTTKYGLHHVLSQTLVRGAGVGHGPANAAMLQHTAGALARRNPDLALRDVEPLARDLAHRARATHLRNLGVARELLPKLADTAAQRPDLDETPPRADREELLALYEAAW